MSESDEQSEHEGAVDRALDPHPFAPSEAFAESDDPAELIEEKADRLRERDERRD